MQTMAEFEHVSVLSVNNPKVSMYHHDLLSLSLPVLQTTNLSKIIFSSLSKYNSVAKIKEMQYSIYC